MTLPTTAGWDFANMQLMFRRVTGTPSTNQISDAEVQALLNDYYVYTMPFELKEQITNQFLTFKTTPGIDIYAFPGGYFTDSPGAYADGFPLVFYQDPDIFYQDWPIQYAVDNIATGDGVTSSFSGGLQNPPVIVNSLFITADATDGTQQLLSSSSSTITTTIATGSGVANYTGTLSQPPIVSGSLSVTDGTETFSDSGAGILSGSLGGTGTINYTTGVYNITFNSAVGVGISIIANYISNSSSSLLSGDGTGTINYLTGAYTANFSSAPPSSAVLYAKYQGYSGNRPQGVLFFNNQFTLRPVPDQAYQIQMQGYIKPTVFSLSTDTPLQNEWGPLIVYGAALMWYISIGDMDNHDRIYPIFKRFENVALGRTIQQLTEQQSVPRF